MAEISHKPDTNGTSGQDTDAHGVMVARARALIPQLRERAAEKTEELRWLFRPRLSAISTKPVCFGFCNPNASVGRSWIMSRWSTAPTRWARQMLPWHGILPTWRAITGCSRCSTREPQHAVWNASADALIASSFIFPAGRARKVDGGYVLSGNWPFSSGVESCEWNMLASVVASDDEADGVEIRIFLVNKQDYRIKDIWNATGLRGTGSRTRLKSRTPLSQKRCRSPQAI